MSFNDTCPKKISKSKEEIKLLKLFYTYVPWTNDIIGRLSSLNRDFHTKPTMNRFEVYLDEEATFF